VTLTDEIATEHVLPKLGEAQGRVAIDHHLVEFADHKCSPLACSAGPKMKKALR